MSYRLLVFDWDGTLMDSVASIVACLHSAVAELGLAPVTEAEIRGTIGLGLDETMARLFPGLDQARSQDIIQGYRRHWLATYRETCVLFPGVAATLAGLAEEGYLLAVATGKSRRGLERDLGRCGFDQLFQAIRTADDAPGKPHPRMLLDILDELGTRPGDALMIGDTTHDLEMARHAGVAALGVTCGSHPREWLEQLEPLACLPSVVEVPAWLAERRGEGGSSRSSP